MPKTTKMTKAKAKKKPVRKKAVKKTPPKKAAPGKMKVKKEAPPKKAAGKTTGRKMVARKKAASKKASSKRAAKGKAARKRSVTGQAGSRKVRVTPALKGRTKKRGKKAPAESSESVRLPGEIGIIPLRDTVIFPYMIAPLVIGRPKSLHLVDEAANTDRMVGLATQVKPDTEEPTPSDLHGVGTAATILKMLKFPDGSTRVLVQGTSRIRIKRYSKREPYLRAEIEPVPEVPDTSVETQALLRSV